MPIRPLLPINDGQVVIKRAFSNNELQETTKTGNIRRYQITPYFENVLDNIEQQLSPFVFVRYDGKPYTSKNLNQIWHKACNEVGIKIKMYNGVRHSLGCQLLDQGCDMDLVREQLGHTKTEMTRRYAKRSKQTLADALKARREKVVQFRKKIIRINRHYRLQFVSTSIIDHNILFIVVDITTI